MVNDILQMHCDQSVTINIGILLGETILPEEEALTIITFLIEFLSLWKDITSDLSMRKNVIKT